MTIEIVDFPFKKADLSIVFCMFTRGFLVFCWICRICLDFSTCETFTHSLIEHRSRIGVGWKTSSAARDIISATFWTYRWFTYEKWWFSMAMLNNQMVTSHFCWLWSSGGWCGIPNEQLFGPCSNGAVLCSASKSISLFRSGRWLMLHGHYKFF